MAGSSGNTTSLNMGGTVGSRNFGNYTASAISTEISRQNYRQVVVSDQRMQKFRDAVYKLVSKWTDADKMNLLTQYGDASAVRANHNEETLNRALTESIIIHLDPSELEQLYKDVMVQQASLKNDIKTLSKRPKYNYRSLNIRNFESVYSRVKNSDNTKNYLKNRKSIISNEFKVPKQIISQYGKLRNELTDLLTTSYNVIELTSTAFSMGLEISDGMSKKQLITWIINKTILYVELVTGKNKKVSSLSNAIMDPKPYDNLLQYTSYAYITGKPGMSGNAWKTLRDNARKAQRAIRERAGMQSSRAKASSKEFREASGLRGAKTLGQAARLLNRHDTGILANASFDKLVELAGKYGVDPRLMKGKDEGALKAHIYSAMAAESKRINKLVKQEKNAKTFGDRRRARDLLSAHDYNIDAVNTTPVENNLRSGIPVVKFNSTGTITSKTILEAVPVFLVGQGGRGNVPEHVRGGSVGESFNDSVARGAYQKAAGIKASDELSESDKKFFEWVLSLRDDTVHSGNPMGDNPNAASAVPNRANSRGTPTTLNALEGLMYAKYYVNRDRFMNVLRMTDNLRIPRNIVYAWAFALATKRIKLADKIQKDYNIPHVPWSIVMKVRRAVRGFGKGLGITAMYAGAAAAGGIIGVLGLALGRAIAKGVSARRKYNSGIFEDLPQKDRDFYNTLNKQPLSQIIQIASRFYPIDRINTFVGDYEAAKDNADIKNGLIAVIAWAKGMNLTARYAERQMNGLERSDQYRDLKRARNIFKRIASGFRSIANFFSKHKSLKPGSDLDGAAEVKKTPAEIAAERNWKGPIPVMLDVRTEIYSGDAIPVFVVNTLTGGIGNVQENSGLINTGHLNKGDIGGNSVFGHITGGINADVNNSITGGSGSITQGHNSSNTGDVVGRDIRNDINKKDKVSINIKDSSVGSLNLSNDILSQPRQKEHNEGEKPTVGALLKTNSEIQKTQKDLLDQAVAERDSKKKEGNSSSLTNAAMNQESESLIPSKNRSINKNTKIQPVFVVNSALGANEGIIASLNRLNGTINDNFSTLFTGLASPMTIAAPYGVGTAINSGMITSAVKSGITNAILDTAISSVQKIGESMGLASGGTVTRANTGASLRRKNIAKFASGGTSVITGDAAGNNIFAQGAKPELVQSNGDMIVTPLNKMGTEVKQKISRMTTNERKSALATGITSHIIKYAYKLPAGAQEISDAGEAIKVFNVKPGITDTITTAAGDTTLADLVAGIYAQLAVLTSSGTTTNQLLGTIAGNTAVTSSPASSGGNANPFAGGFPESLDDITGGN